MPQRSVTMLARSVSPGIATSVSTVSGSDTFERCVRREHDIDSSAIASSPRARTITRARRIGALCHRRARESRGMRCSLRGMTASHALAVDLGGTRLKAAWVAEDGRIDRYFERDSCARDGVDASWSALREVLDDLRDGDGAAAIGIGM